MNAIDIILVCIGIFVGLILIVLTICLSTVMSWNESTNNLSSPENQSLKNDTDNGYLKINEV